MSMNMFIYILYIWITFATASDFHSCEFHFGALVSCIYGDDARCECEWGGWHGKYRIATFKSSPTIRIPRTICNCIQRNFILYSFIDIAAKRIWWEWVLERLGGMLATESNRTQLRTDVNVEWRWFLGNYKIYSVKPNGKRQKSQLENQWWGGIMECAQRE